MNPKPPYKSSCGHELRRFNFFLLHLVPAHAASILHHADFGVFLFFVQRAKPLIIRIQLSFFVSFLRRFQYLIDHIADIIQSLQSLLEVTRNEEPERQGKLSGLEFASCVFAAHADVQEQI